MPTKHPRGTDGGPPSGLSLSTTTSASRRELGLGLGAQELGLGLGASNREDESVLGRRHSFQARARRTMETPSSLFHEVLATVRETAAAHASALNALEHAVDAQTVPFEPRCVSLNHF